MSQNYYLTNTLYVGLEKKIEAPKIWRPSDVGLVARALGRPCSYDEIALPYLYIQQTGYLNNVKLET
jgi:hypothetical protein